MLTILTQENCQPCIAVKRMFDKFGVKYSEADKNQSEELLNKAIKHGATSTPVIFNEESEVVFCGFRPDIIKKLVSADS